MNKTKKEADKQYTFFWSGPFSNWYKANFEADGQKYTCTEQHMMYHKAMLFGDEEIANAIMRTNNPREQKALGRKVKRFDPKVWDEKCLNIVTEGNIQKFGQNPELKKKMMETVGKIICEASPKDAIWGCGHSEDDHLCWNESTWRGKNYLGICLMRVRDHFQL